jgi:hypothetical protein
MRWADDPVSDRQVVDFRWYYGEAGSGKSSGVWDEFGDEHVYAKNPRNKWWDGYDPSRHSVVLVDDFRPSVKDSAHDLTFDYLLRMCDIYPFISETKGGGLTMRPPVIIITSNHSLEHSFDAGQLPPLLRRFKQKEFIRVDGYGQQPARSVDGSPANSSVRAIIPVAVVPKPVKAKSTKPVIDTSYAGRSSYVKRVGLGGEPLAKRQRVVDTVDLTQDSDPEEDPEEFFLKTEEDLYLNDSVNPSSADTVIFDEADM